MPPTLTPSADMATLFSPAAPTLWKKAGPAGRNHMSLLAPAQSVPSGPNMSGMLLPLPVPIVFELVLLPLPFTGMAVDAGVVGPPNTLGMWKSLGMSNGMAEMLAGVTARSVSWSASSGFRI